jgi:amino acid transporter
MTLPVGGETGEEQLMEQATRPQPTGLRRNAIGLPGAVIMSAAVMGPAVSTFFNPQFSTPFSGFATPLVYVLCLIAMLITASGVIEMARALPSAGAFYTYVTRGFGPKAGFITGGLIFVAYALLPPAEIGLIGSYLQKTFNDEGIGNIPWWIIGLVPAIVMTVLAFEGIVSSLRTTLILFSAEVVVVVLMAVIVVVNGGHESLNLHPFDPGSSPHGFGGLVTGGIFAALSFVGFEAAASLGEEVKEPRKRIPKAILGATLLVGGIYAFCIWAESMGLGQAGTNALSPESSPPWNFLAAEYASWMKWPVIVASVSSMFAVMLASNNGIVRILHKMGREGLLPSFFGHVDPKRRTPIYAVLFQGVFAVCLAFIVGGIAGGLGDSTAGGNVYGYLGFLLTMGILPVYVLTNAAAVRFYRERGDFNPVPHLLLPGLGALLMVGLTIGQIVEQIEAPYTWFPWVIVGWVALVAVGAAWLGARRPEALKAAGAAMGSVDDIEEEPDLALGVA